MFTVKFFKIIYIGIGLITLIGCVHSFYHQPLDYADDKNGWLIVYCSNPPGQSEVVRHIIQVDGHDTFEVAAKGQVPIFLSAGQHTLHFLSAGSLQGSHPYPGYTVFHDNFYIYGLGLEKKITVAQGKRREVKYVAPFWNYETGMIKVLK